MGRLHNTRFLRFIIALATVVLTIFLYASYSSNASLSPPPHVRSSSSAASASSAVSYMSAQPLQQQQQQEQQSPQQHVMVAAHRNSTGAGDAMLLSAADNANSIRSHTVMKLNKKSLVSLVKKHREPTIDIDGVAGGGGGISGNVGGNGLDDVPDVAFVSNDLLEEQYGQNVENVLGNINNSIASAADVAADIQQISVQQPSELQQQQQDQQLQQQQQNQLNKIPDSDVLIPTSNLQKFIENADKILKNITVAPPSPSVLAAVGGGGGENVALSDGAEAATANKQSEKDMSPAHTAAEKSPINSQQQNPSKTNKKNDSNKSIDNDVVMTIKQSDGDSGNAAIALKSSQQQQQQRPPTPKVKMTPKPNVTNTGVVDTTQGIQTQRIYESGHLNDEINIERLCPKAGADLKLLILITSAQAHADARLSIRQTWGHYGIRRDVTTAFILGRTRNESLNSALSQENFIYGDLIRGNFIDSYNNLTLKTVSALEWVDEHCARAKYVLKTDDDMFINVPKLLAFLDSHAKEKRVIFGRLAKKWKPIRNAKSKYYVSTGQFGAPVFPPFTTGPAYVMSQDIIHELYVRSLHQVYLKLEDVFTTGIVAQQLGIKRVHVNEFLNRRIAFNPCNIRKTISVHMIKANEQFDLWKKLLDQSTKCK